jgi:hypothetical protein
MPRSRSCNGGGPSAGDSATKKHAEAPVRSFVLTLAYRDARECLRGNERALTAV